MSIEGWRAAMSEPIRRPVCSGPCQQGRKPCETPAACMLPEDELTIDFARALIVAAVILCLTAVVAALVYGT